MRFWTLLQLQWWDARRNPMIMLFSLITVVMGGIMAMMMSGSGREMGVYTLGMMLIMSAYFVGYNVAQIGLVEDKEKRTLEALLLTPVRPIEIVLSRALLALVMTAATGLILVLIFRQIPARPAVLAGGFLLTMLFAIATGTLVGLISPDMKSTGYLGTPIVMALIFATTLPWKLFLPAVWEAQAWLPTRPAADLIEAGVSGAAVPLVRDVLLMAGYTALVIWLCTRQMRRFGAARR
jgi:ABC-2 type transport system permease protein